MSVLPISPTQDEGDRLRRTATSWTGETGFAGLIVHGTVLLSAHVRIEGEDHQGAHAHHQHDGGRQHQLQPETGAVPAGVVVDDHAQPVGAVDPVSYTHLRAHETVLDLV